MLRICGKKLRVAMAGVAALAWLGAGLAVAQTPQKPAFARIALSKKSAVYIQIEGNELRAAMSVEGLQTATPGKAGSECALPVPEDQLPAGVTAINANLRLMQLQVRTGQKIVPTPYIMGRLTVCRTDDQKAEWQYVSSVGIQGAATADKAASINLPDLDKVKAALAATPSKGKLAVGLRLTAGSAMLADVRKDGKPVQVQMVVTNASGAEIASKAGPLTTFGFS
jgi:hypothetical protein